MKFQRDLANLCIGSVWAVRGVLPTLTQWDIAQDLWGRVRLVGLEMSTVALPAGQWLPVSPCTCSSLPAAAGLANITAFSASLSQPIKTAAVTLLLTPCRCHCLGVTLLVSPSQRHSSSAEQQVLGEMGVPGCSAYAHLHRAAYAGVQGGGFGVLWCAISNPKPFPDLGSAAITPGTQFPAPLGC